MKSKEVNCYVLTENEKDYHFQIPREDLPAYLLNGNTKAQLRLGELKEMSIEAKRNIEAGLKRLKDTDIVWMDAI